MSTAGRMLANMLAGILLAVSIQGAILAFATHSVLFLLFVPYPVFLILAIIAPGYPWGKFLDKVVGGYDDPET